MYCLKLYISSHADNEEDSEDSGSDVEVKKGGRRHHLLRHKLSLSDGESGEEKAASNQKRNKGTKKKSEQEGLLELCFGLCVCSLSVTVWLQILGTVKPANGCGFFFSLMLICLVASSDDSSDSDFEKSESSDESQMSEELSESENEGKRRKTR